MCMHRLNGTEILICACTDSMELKSRYKVLSEPTLTSHEGLEHHQQLVSIHTLTTSGDTVEGVGRRANELRVADPCQHLGHDSIIVYPVNWLS